MQSTTNPSNGEQLIRHSGRIQRLQLALQSEKDPVRRESLQAELLRREAAVSEFMGGMKNAQHRG